MDISQNFTYGAIADGNGALINGASDNSNTGTTDMGDSDLYYFWYCLYTKQSICCY